MTHTYIHPTHFQTSVFLQLQENYISHNAMGSEGKGLGLKGALWGKLWKGKMAEKQSEDGRDGCVVFFFNTKGGCLHIR